MRQITDPTQMSKKPTGDESELGLQPIGPMALMEAAENRAMATRRREEPSVAGMLQAVIEKGVTTENVAALQQLVGLYERMQERDAEKSFAQAFAAAQSKLKRIEAVHAVPDKHGNTKYMVSKFSEIWDAVEPVLAEHGFTAGFSQRMEEGMPLRVTTSFILQHTESGHKTVTPFTVRVGSGPPGCSDFQADGAASSYAKARAVCAALNIIIIEGDDAREEGKPIGMALAQDLMVRVRALKLDEESFLKFAGVHAMSVPAELDDYMKIADDRYERLDEILAKKELATT